MATGEDAVVLLRSIDASLKALVARTVPSSTPAVAISPPAVASDADLDGRHGDPIVKAKSPRDWSGDDMTGRRMSQCPPAYLDLVAQRLDYFAAKAEATHEQTTSSQPAAPYKRKDAARARGWAARLRAGWTPPKDPFASDEIVF